MYLLKVAFIFTVFALYNPVWCTAGDDCESDPLSCGPTEKCVAKKCAARSACDPSADCNDHGVCETDKSCTCNPGYEAIDCSKDKDECTIPTSCHKDASCTNTVGSFTCKCKDGFTGDGKTACTGPVTGTNTTVTNGTGLMSNSSVEESKGTTPGSQGVRVWEGSGFLVALLLSSLLMMLA